MFVPHAPGTQMVLHVGQRTYPDGGKHRELMRRHGDGDGATMSDAEIARLTSLPPQFARGNLVALVTLGETVLLPPPPPPPSPLPHPPATTPRQPPRAVTPPRASPLRVLPPLCGRSPLRPPDRLPHDSISSQVLVEPTAARCTDAIESACVATGAAMGRYLTTIERAEWLKAPVATKDGQRGRLGEAISGHHVVPQAVAEGSRLPSALGRSDHHLRSHREAVALGPEAAHADVFAAFDHSGDQGAPRRVRGRGARGGAARRLARPPAVGGGRRGVGGGRGRGGVRHGVLSRLSTS